MKAEIIAIGDELLIGQVVDTNSSWIAGRLNELGIEVNNISVISDDKQTIVRYVEEGLNRSDVIIMTGGLGPTNDDITKFTLADFFKTKLVFSDHVYANICGLLKDRGLSLNGKNKTQAMVPEDCNILNNLKGTAPGMWFTSKGKHLFSLPGVPFEMKYLMDNEVLPVIKNLNKDSEIIVSRTVNIYNIAESALAETIEEWENALPNNMSLAYLPSLERIRLRLTARGRGRDELIASVDGELEKLSKYVSFFKNFASKDMEQVLGELLKENGKTVATAESCTGGNIAHLITSVPGSSDYFKGSIVAYSNQVKEEVLKVNINDIEKYGAVSEDVVKQMAVGVRNIMQADYAVATSGVAGPSGGTEDKPVGTVWIAVASEDNVIAKKYIFSGTRERNIAKSSVMAIDMLMGEINK